EGWRIAEGVPGRLAEGMSGCLQLLARGAVVVPGLRKLILGIAGLGEPGPAVGEQPGNDRPWHAEPLLAVIGDDLEEVPMAALGFADLLGHIADIDNAVGVKLRPIAEPKDDIRPRAGLNRRGNPRLDIIGVDALDIELNTKIFLALRGDLAAQQLVGGRDEIVPAQPMEGRLLRVSRSPPRRQEARDPAGLRR